MLRYFQCTILLLSLTFINAQTQITIGDSLSGQNLLNYVTLHYKTNTTLGYDTARDTLYSIIDLHDDSLLTCVYTDYTIALNGITDPSTDAFYKGINCEHSWPQSMGAVDEPQKSDMHHLFPCKDNVNSSRGNDPYGEIPDSDTDTWYWLDTSTTTIPTINIDLWSEKENDGAQTFEPREDHKGNAARAMFYFFAMYQNAADINFWNVQKETLLDWHYYDSIDTNEYDRTYQIASYQENNPNPFVLDSSLARRIWFTETTGDTTVLDTTVEQIIINEIMQNPSVVSDAVGEWFEVVNVGTTVVDMLGWIIKDNDTDIHTVSSSVIIEPDSFIVFGRNGDNSANGGYIADYVYTGIILANSLDELLLINTFGLTIDSVAWDGGSTFPDPTGASMALLSTNYDNNIGANWATSDTPFGAGDYGTPGYENYPLVLNSPPIANPDSITINEDENVTIDVAANDFDQDGEDIFIIGVDTTNTLGFAMPHEVLNQVNYEPPLNYFGLDSFDYIISDGNGGLDTGSVYITIIPINDPPSIVTLISPDSIIVNTLTPEFCWTQAIDPDPGDTITYTLNWWPIGPLPVIYGVVIDTNSYIPADSITDNSHFGWRVEARDLNDSTSVSDTSYFYTDAFPEAPLAFNTLYPPNNEVVEDGYVTLIWENTIDPDPLDSVDFSLLLSATYGEPENVDTISIGIDTAYTFQTYTGISYYWKIVASDGDGMSTYSNNGDWSQFLTPDLSVLNVSLIPEVFALHPATPNPFNPTTSIRYDLPEDAYVRITIYDLLGRQIINLVNTDVTAGYRSALWNGTDTYGKPVSSGMYIYQIQAGSFVQSKKMVLLK